MASSTRQHETETLPPQSVNRRLAFSVFAPPVAWFAHEIVGVSTVGRHCAASEELTGGQWTILVAVSLVAAAIAVAAALTAYRVFTRETSAPPIVEAEGWGRVEFVALLGMFLSTLLLLNIIYFAVMPFVVEPCLRTT